MKFSDKSPNIVDEEARTVEFSENASSKNRCKCITDSVLYNHINSVILITVICVIVVISLL